MPALPPDTPTDLPDWARPGAVFAVDGGNERIIRVTPAEIEVVTFDSFGAWPVRSFLTAWRDGRITRPANTGRTAPRPRTPLVSNPRRGTLPELTRQERQLPIPRGTPPREVVRIVLRALTALWSGAPVKPPALVLVEMLARAGAYAEGLGPAVAFRTGLRGRYPLLQREALEAQELLQRLSLFLAGGEALTRLEFRTIEHFVERGLEAFGFIAPPVPRGRGRQRKTPHEALAVQREISRRWRAYRDGRFNVRQAIQIMAEDVVLHHRQVDAAWDGRDPDAVRLGPEDEEEVATVFHRIEVTYYRLPPLDGHAMARHRRDCAVMLRAQRRIKRDLCEYRAGGA